jgi:hypothetical protein
MKPHGAAEQVIPLREYATEKVDNQEAPPSYREPGVASRQSAPYRWWNWYMAYFTRNSSKMANAILDIHDELANIIGRTFLNANQNTQFSDKLVVDAESHVNSTFRLGITLNDDDVIATYNRMYSPDTAPAKGTVYRGTVAMLLDAEAETDKLDAAITALQAVSSGAAANGVTVSGLLTDCERLEDTIDTRSTLEHLEGYHWISDNLGYGSLDTPTLVQQHTSEVINYFRGNGILYHGAAVVNVADGLTIVIRTTSDAQGNLSYSATYNNLFPPFGSTTAYGVCVLSNSRAGYADETTGNWSKQGLANAAYVANENHVHPHGGVYVDVTNLPADGKIYLFTATAAGQQPTFTLKPDFVSI